MAWMVRSWTSDKLEALKPRVVAALEAGASATGCTCSHDIPYPPYDEVLDNAVMQTLYAGNVSALGRPAITSAEAGVRVVGSTDMGNVSKVVPSIHPMIQVAPQGVSIHSHEFAKHARSSKGDEAVILGAKAMAMTIADLWSEPERLAAAKAELSSTTR